jgi:hypothetical protein
MSTKSVVVGSITALLALGAEAINNGLARTPQMGVSLTRPLASWRLPLPQAIILYAHTDLI